MSPQDWIDATVLLLITVVWSAILCEAAFIHPGPNSLAVAQIATPVILAVIGWRGCTVYLRKRPNGNGNGNGNGKRRDDS